MAHEKHYEMQWDCKYCGSNKLLGKTHRFCPNCGAAQDPKSRYFPSDEEKVAVEDHEYHGADLICSACDTLNSANSTFCQQCGAPLENAKRASILEDGTMIADGEAFQSSGPRDLAGERFKAQMEGMGYDPETRKKKKEGGGFNWKTLLIIGVLIALIGGCIYTFTATSEADVVVEGHSWERVIEVDAFSAIRSSSWQDQVPGDAYGVSCRREQRSTRQIPDGEDCSTRRVDNGDGTYREQRVCSPRYRSEPVYDQKCNYTVNRWAPSRQVTSSGSSLQDAPSWPNANLRQTGTCLGCEREGGRQEQYIVHFRQDDKTYTCAFSQGDWTNFPIESVWTMEIGVVTGQPDCSSIQPAS